jgi:hypothetical protein
MDQHDHLEEIDASNPPPAAPAPAAPATPSALAAAPTQPYPQFMRFMIGGVLVLIGCFLPFGSALTTTMVPKETLVSKADSGPPLSTGEEIAAAMKNNKPIEAKPVAVPASLPTMQGIATFTGALWLLIALGLIHAMRQSFCDNKIRLKPVLLMLIPCGWAWVKLFEVKANIEGFDIAAIYKIRMLEHLAQSVGSGFLLVLIGSTYVSIQFILAIVGALTGGKKQEGGDPTASSARRRR